MCLSPPNLQHSSGMNLWNFLRCRSGKDEKYLKYLPWHIFCSCLSLWRSHIRVCVAASGGRGRNFCSSGGRNFRLLGDIPTYLHTGRKVRDPTETLSLSKKMRLINFFLNFPTIPAPKSLWRKNPLLPCQKNFLKNSPPPKKIPLEEGPLPPRIFSSSSPASSKFPKFRAFLPPGAQECKEKESLGLTQ